MKKMQKKERKGVKQVRRETRRKSKHIKEERKMEDMRCACLITSPPHPLPKSKGNEKRSR